MSVVEGSPKAWLLIFDPTLRSLEGHSYNYDLAVASEAKGRFDAVVIFADEAFKPGGEVDVPIKAIVEARWFKGLRSAVGRAFPRNDSGALPNLPAAGVPGPFQYFWKELRARGLARSIVRALALLEAEPQDRIHIFVQRADLFEIAGVDAFCRRNTWVTGRHLTFHLLLRHDPDITRARQESPAAFRARLRRLSARENPEIRFHTDSEPIARSYRQLTGIHGQFSLMPVPVCAMAAAAHTQRPKTKNFVRISVLGAPRIEKGFGLLDKLIPLFPGKFGAARVHVAVQINRRVADRNVVRVNRWLDAYAASSLGDGPVLELLDGPAPEDIYFSWLSGTDVLIAPYVSQKYIRSTSGIFVEALHFCVPSVVMRGTWAAGLIAEAAQQGLSIGEVADGVAAIPERSRAIWTQLSRYKADIEAYVHDWKQKYSLGIAELLLAAPRSAS
jgi:hypothetical protein